MVYSTDFKRPTNPKKPNVTLKQLVLPKSLHGEVLTALHQDLTAGHLGVERTLIKGPATILVAWCHQRREKMDCNLPRL